MWYGIMNWQYKCLVKISFFYIRHNALWQLNNDTDDVLNSEFSEYHCVVRYECFIIENSFSTIEKIQSMFMYLVNINYQEEEALSNFTCLTCYASDETLRIGIISFLSFPSLLISTFVRRE